MNELHRYYRSRLIAFAVGIALAALFIPAAFIPWLESFLGAAHWGLKSAEFLTSRFALVVYLAVAEWIIRNRLWRMEKKEFDFRGIWKGTTFYTGAPIGDAKVPFESNHEVRIEQDSLFLKIAPAEGEHYTNWGSLALQLVDKDTIVYAYWVKYGKDKRFPERARGLEEMSVTQRDSNKRPLKLTGTFAHCPEGQEPVYTGRVEFVRVAEDDRHK